MRYKRAVHCVLGALSLYGESTKSQIAETTGVRFRLPLILIRLEQSGEIESRWQEGPYPRMRLYRLKQK